MGEITATIDEKRLLIHRADKLFSRSFGSSSYTIDPDDFIDRFDQGNHVQVRLKRSMLNRVLLVFGCLREDQPNQILVRVGCTQCGIVLSESGIAWLPQRARKFRGAADTMLAHSGHHICLAKP